MTRSSRAARAAHLFLIAVVLAAGSTACSQQPPAKRYPLEGQVLAIAPEKLAITIKHGDIPNFMPAMTMTYDVASASLLDGRVPGEAVKATLEVADSYGKIVAIEHAGNAPLPDTSNEVAMASGVLDIGGEVPDVALIDQTNTRRALSDWKGTPTLVTFIYTRCPLPTFCPLMDRNFRAIQTALTSDPALEGKAKLISISFDPEHDTPDVLAAHATDLGANPAIWTMLTGDRVTVDRIAAKFGVGVIRTPEDPTQITHNLRTILIGSDFRIARIYSGNDWTPAAVLADLRAIVHTP